MSLHLGECKAKKHNQEIKECGKIFLPEADKDSIGVITKVMLSSNTGEAWGLYLGCLHMFI